MLLQSIEHQWYTLRCMRTFKYYMQIEDRVMCLRILPNEATPVIFMSRSLL